MEPVTLTTERLVLHVPDDSDIDAITAACQDPEIPRWTTVPSPYTREHGEGYVRLIGEWWADGSQAIWCAYRDDELVASIGLHRIVEHSTGGDAEIGYWVTASARGNGYLVEAARRRRLGVRRARPRPPRLACGRGQRPVGPSRPRPRVPV